MIPRSDVPTIKTRKRPRYGLFIALGSGVLVLVLVLTLWMTFVQK